MARTPEGPPPPPAVQKLRVRYAKRGRLRFSSTRDFQRALERALRRAAVPMAFSAGFHPAPQDLLRQRRADRHGQRGRVRRDLGDPPGDPDSLREALDEALPVGLDVLQVVEAAPGALADRLQASDWVMEFRGMPVQPLEEAAQALLQRDEVQVTRMMKSGPRTFDVRVRRRVAERFGRRGRLVCDTEGGRTAHHTGRAPRRCSDRAARSCRARAADTTPGDSAGAGAAANCNRDGG